MKILIIALGRTGSTSLLFKLGEEYDLNVIMEPLERNLFREDEDNIIIKTLIWQIPKGENEETWFKTLIPKFNKVILLTRKDLKSLTESLSFYRHRKNTGFFSNTPYLWEKTPNYYEIENMVNDYNKKLINLGQELGIETTYYEDIFDVNSEERLRLGDIKKRNLL
jgi:hypothetical protein